MRKRLQNMGVRITELSELMGVSRPTFYKYLDMYDLGEREKIDPKVLKLLDHIRKNPRIGKRDVLYYILLIQGGKGRMETDDRKVSRIVTVTIVERPARKLVLLRSKEASDYLSYCEEMGCWWEKIMNGIQDRYDDAAIVELPISMTAAGTSGTASGVEVPSDFKGDLPAEYEIIDLPPCTMLYFCGSLYDNEEDFCEAIGIVSDAMEAYEPERFGWKYAPDDAPSFNFGASAEKGARTAVPVRAR
jgi:hypothetical protein